MSLAVTTLEGANRRGKSLRASAPILPLWACIKASGPPLINTINHSLQSLSLLLYNTLLCTGLSYRAPGRNRGRTTSRSLVSMYPTHLRFFTLEDGFLVPPLTACTGRRHFQRGGGQFFVLHGRHLAGCCHHHGCHFYDAHGRRFTNGQGRSHVSPRLR